MYQHVLPTLLHLHQYSLKLVWIISFLQWLHAIHACHLCFATGTSKYDPTKQFHFPFSDSQGFHPKVDAKVRYTKDDNNEVVDVIKVILDSETNVHYF